MDPRPTCDPSLPHKQPPEKSPKKIAKKWILVYGILFLLIVAVSTIGAWTVIANLQKGTLETKANTVPALTKNISVSAGTGFVTKETDTTTPVEQALAYLSKAIDEKEAKLLEQGEKIHFLEKTILELSEMSINKSAMMERNISKLTESVWKASMTIQGLCPVYSHGRCYIPVVTQHVPRAEAARRCARMGASLADIESLYLFSELMVYIRKHKMNSQGYLAFHLGMTVDPSTRQVFFSNGKSPTYKPKWDDKDFTQDQNYTALLLRVNRNEASAGQNYWNRLPSAAWYFICSKEME